MLYTIKNGILEATISSLAAEVVSLKKDDKEYIWDRNKEDWHNCNPILFPIVGPLKDNKYTYNNRQYTLTQHGFLRRSEFRFEEIKKDELTLSFISDEDSKKLYPFDFKMTVKYQLVEDKLVLNYKLDNLDERQLPFDIGFHPAFVCANFNDEKFNDYYVQFEVKEDNIDQKISLKDLVNEQKDETFYHGGFKSKYVQLSNGKETIRVCIDGFETLGFWRKYPTSDFLCIEPQHPFNSLKKSDFFNRETTLNNLLEAKESFSTSYYWQFITESH